MSRNIGQCEMKLYFADHNSSVFGAGSFSANRSFSMAITSIMATMSASDTWCVVRVVNNTFSLGANITLIIYLHTYIYTYKYILFCNQ